MNTRRLVLMAAGIAACLPSHALVAGQPALQARLERLRADTGVPALAGALFTSSAVTQQAAVGTRRTGDAAEVTTHDLWHIGSITKSFTSLLAARSVEQGALHWTDTLKDLIGSERAGRFADVTVAHLLSHRAGVPANLAPPTAVGIVASGLPVVEQRRRIVDTVLGTTPLSEPGAGFLYSNLGYIILASVLEQRSGESWETLVQQEVLTPARLTSAGQGPPGIGAALTQPWGHRRTAEGALVAVPPGPVADNPPYMGPAGRLHMTIGHLATWGRHHLRGAQGHDGLVTAATFARLHRPDTGDYALGWVRQSQADGRQVIWHNGSNTMWYAIVAFDPDRDVGVALATNGGIAVAQAVDAAAMALLRDNVARER